MTDTSGPVEPPATANPGAVATMGLDLRQGRPVPRKQVVSWAFWDWATQPFHTVILTFIFVALYLTSDVFLDPAVAALGEGHPDYEAGIAGLTSGLGVANTIAGALIALLAPVLGQRADGTGHRKRSLGISTGLLVAAMLALFFVQGAPAYFALGVGLVAAGSVFSEIAGVHYNAMLIQVSTRSTVGKVSGLGWGFGYIGGILALTLVLVVDTYDWFGMSTDNGLPYRVIAVGCAVWAIVFCIPIFRNVPEPPRDPNLQQVGLLASYGKLIRHIASLWRTTRTTFWFLLASAVFRDGLAGVFAYGAVIASVVFGFDFQEVVLFGIAASLIAGIATIIAGRFDDLFGPRTVILTALTSMVVLGIVIFMFRDAGEIIFWIAGLALCAFVGPAQSASRSFLARVTPAGREGETFGLYATTGRAASFLSPALWTAFIALSGTTAWGIIGIIAVLAAGLILMLFVKAPQPAS